MSYIRTEKTTNGFAAYFPFELKDSFRSTFKTAKWNPQLKRWEVGPRSGARLETWAASMAKVAESIATDADKADAQHLSNDDIERLNQEKLRLTELVKSTRDDAQRYRTLKAQLDSEIAKVADDLNHAKEQALAAKESLMATLKAVVDIEAIRDAHGVMVANHDKVKSAFRYRFEEAQEEIAEQRNKLLAIGLESEGLNRLVSANFNRPDRDHARYVTDKHLYQLSRVEEDD